MKDKCRKKIFGAAAVLLAGAFGVGAVLQTSLSVEASTPKMPGIETIVKENTGTKPFRILELVNDSADAEIGYYVSGQEPSVKLYSYTCTDENGEEQTIHFSTFEEGLARLPESLRSAFVRNVQVKEDGTIDEEASTGISKAVTSAAAAQEAPASYSEYQEKYFLTGNDSTDDWKEIALTGADGLSRTDTVQVEGHYTENTAGTGDYTKEEQQYYPIRKSFTGTSAETVAEDAAQPEKYRENIETFNFNEILEDSDRPAYYLQFTEVDNAKINAAFSDYTDLGNTTLKPEYDPDNGRYGYFENLYTDLTSEIVENIQKKTYTFPGENPDSVDETAQLLVDQPKEAVAYDPQALVEDPLDDMEEDPALDDDSAVTDGTENGAQISSSAPSGNDSNTTGNTGNNDSNAGNNVTEDNTTSDDTVSEPSMDSDTGNGSSTTDSGSSTSGTEEVIPQQAQPEASSGIAGMRYTAVAGKQVMFAAAIDSLAASSGAGETESGSAASSATESAAPTQSETQNETSSTETKSNQNIPDPTKGVDRTMQNASSGSATGETQDLTETENAQAQAATGNGTRAILKSIANEETAGTQANPYIYFATSIAEYPYYKYTLVCDLDYLLNTDNIQVDDPDKEATHTAGQISLTDGQYLYWATDEDNQLVSTALQIVTGRQPVDYDNLHTISTELDYNYYYRVEKVYFCAKAGENAAADPSSYSYYGWYYPEYPADGEQYIAASGEKATYYISQAQYQLTRGIGNYDFVPGGTTAEAVQVDHVYYRGGYTNNDWFRQYVFHMDSTDADFDSFQIEVDTRSAADVTKAVYASAAHTGGDTVLEDAGETKISDYDLIYINGALSEETASAILNTTVPCIVGSKAYGKAVFTDKFSGFLNTEDADQSYVRQYMYMFVGADADMRLVNVDFAQTFSTEKQLGFEEITSYIQQENEYRKLGEDGQQLEALSTELSQARAIEYIINYQYKRTVVTKKNIKVLEITPDKIDADLEEKTVLNWLGIGNKIETITPCCASSSDPITNIMDGNTSTIWHSDWSSYENKHHEHSLTIAFHGAQAVRGFTYTPRPAGSENGVLQKYKVELRDTAGNLLKEIPETEIPNALSDRSQKTLIFDAVQNVKTMKIIFSQAGSEEWGNRFASCAELGIVYADDSAAEDDVHATVTRMTAAEFVGHKEDLLAQYDLVYISGKKSGNTPMLTGAGELCYAHVGSAIQMEQGNEYRTKFLGQLDTEWDPNWSSGTMRRFAPITTMVANGGGIFRGSGNDMTKQQCEKLLDFVKSGYPVVIDSALMQNGSIKTACVDNSSYYYEFLSEALAYDNVMNASDLEDGTKDISFFANLSKPVIEFSEKPAEPQENDTSDASYIKDELKYVFTVKNDSDAAPAATTYDCKLYLDLNFDGNLSEKESQSKYIVIQDENGQVVSQVSYNGEQRYELQAGKTYTLTRKIPSDYFKLITWKLEVSSNRNSYIHTSETGYTKQKNKGQKQVINVLQLIPQSCTWNLSTDKNFQDKIRNLDDFTINVTTKSVENDINNYTQAQMEALLSDKQMLVIGFADAYKDISNKNHQVDAILAFIESGKSVIFSHDTTSYINYDRQQVYEKIATTAYGRDENMYVSWDGWLYNRGNLTWGLSLNTILRSVVGMDRYGITSKESIGNETLSDLLKKGKRLTDGDSVSFQRLQELAGDVAYETNGSRITSYPQTQSYANSAVDGGISGDRVRKATRVNEGAITQYPFKIGDSISVAETHGQYYQLALEQDRDINGNSDGETDIVVWYCLADGVYSNSPNDARNNYYFYSKGNVIYTGAGHSSVGGDEEIKLFINAMVAAANVTAVQPQIDFVDHLSQNADTESSRFYSTDQSTWADGETNVLEKDMDFYIDVKDYNMVSADLSQEDLDSQEMRISFYIEDDKGETVDGIDQKVTDITAQIGTLYGADGSTVSAGNGKGFRVTKNNAFKVTVPDIERYLKASQAATSTTAAGYKKTCNLYVKVTSTVYLYGQPRTSTSTAQLTLKQRQLFELN